MISRAAGPNRDTHCVGPIKTRKRGRPSGSCIELVNRYAPVDAVLLGRVIASGEVVGAPVVPDDDVASAPRVAVLAIRLDHPLGELVDDRVALLFGESFDAEDLARIEVQGFTTGLGVRAEDWMK